MKGIELSISNLIIGIILGLTYGDFVNVKPGQSLLPLVLYIFAAIVFITINRDVFFESKSTKSKEVK